MKIENNNTIAFKSIPRMYFKEQELEYKNNTARILTLQEVRQIFKVIRTQGLSPSYVKIINTDSGDFFYKYIRDFSFLKLKGDSYLGVFTFHDCECER